MGKHVVTSAYWNAMEGESFLLDLLNIWSRRTAEMDVEPVPQFSSQRQNKMIDGEINGAQLQDLEFPAGWSSALSSTG